MVLALLCNMPWWLNLIITVAVLLLAAEIGFRVARRVKDPAAKKSVASADVVVAALLGLLALLLGFSFSIVEERFGARKALVLEEANAIGTTYLRAKMLPAPHDRKVQLLLRDYVATRLNVGTPASLAHALERSHQLHRELWTEAVAVARQQPQSQVTNLFTTSLNQVIDLNESRITVAIHQRLPLPMRRVLYVVSILALLGLGFGMGLRRSRPGLVTVALVTAVASVIVLIVEIDRPMGSIVQVSQSALVDLHDSMEKELGAPEQSR